MGATALLALTGQSARLGDLRGRFLDAAPGRTMLVTVHPAFLLRIPEPARAIAERARFRDDLAAARRWLEAEGALSGRG